jgi:hypothetical protein
LANEAVAIGVTMVGKKKGLSRRDASMPSTAALATGAPVDALEPRLLFAADPVSTFRPPLNLPQLGSLNQVVAKGDFNGDGYLDLAASGGDYDKSVSGQPSDR